MLQGRLKTEYFDNAPGGSISISDPVKELEFDDTQATDFSNTTLYFDLEGSISIEEHDQISVKEGELVLQNTHLEISGNYVPEIGDEFLLIRKFGSGLITGTFNNLPEGASFFANGAYFIISYQGGNGNDLLLTAQQSPLSDIDNDGYFNDEDCDDFNADINPDADEIPNNDVDEDCDGIALIIDVDNDGFNSDEDCDDNNANVNPDSTEIPNNDVDEDCDGITLIIDVDNDGFNSDEDCDDTNADVNPDGIEIPNNGIDEDCDGADLIVSTHLIQGASFDIFPNPAKNDFILKWRSNQYPAVALKLYNASGLMIKNQFISEAQTIVDISSYTAGMYFLELQDLSTGESVVTKIVFTD